MPSTLTSPDWGIVVGPLVLPNFPRCGIGELSDDNPEQLEVGFAVDL